MWNNKEGEEATVSVRVLVGNDKYKEFRMPKYLDKEKSSLWRCKYEVGKRIAEVMNEKKEQINQLQQQIKQLEKGRIGWQQVAKSVDENSEDFFLNALLASPQEIDRFEKENFLSTHSWSKVRNVSELSKKNRDELLYSREKQGSSSSPDPEEKTNHYEWILQQLATPLSEPSAEIADNSASVSSTLEEVKEDVPSDSKEHEGETDGKKDIQVLNSDEVTDNDLQLPCEGKIETITENFTNVEKVDDLAMTELKTTMTENILEVKTPQTVTDVPEENKETCSAEPQISGDKTEVKAEESLSEVENTTVVANNNNKNTTTVVTPPKQVKTNGYSKNKKRRGKNKNGPPAQVAKCDFEEKVPAPLVTEEQHLEPNNEAGSVQPEEATNTMSDDPKVDEDVVSTNEGATELNVPVEEHVSDATPEIEKEKLSEPLKDITKEEISNSVEKINGTPTDEQSSSSKTNKQMVDPNGYSRLRLTSGSEPKPAQSVEPTPKKVGNIWEQRAAEREEKLKAEKNAAVQNVGPTKLAPQASLISNGQRAIVNTNHHNKGSKSSSQNSFATTSSSNSSTISSSCSKQQQMLKGASKTVDENGWITLNNKKGRNSPPKTLEPAEDIRAPKQTETREKQVPKANKEEEAAKSSKEVAQQDSEDEDDIEPKNRAEIQEKRARRRQRVRERNKENARQTKEENKKIKEINRLKMEAEIEDKKKARQNYDTALYECRIRELEAIRRQRDEEEMMKKNAGDIVNVKQKMQIFLKDKSIKYRLTSASVYISARKQELANDKSLIINAHKYNTLLHLEKELKDIYIKNNFMIFISYLMLDKTSSKKFELNDLMEYMHNEDYHIPDEHENQLQRGIREEYSAFYKKNMRDPADAMVKAIQFAENALKKFSTVKTPSVTSGRTIEILAEFKKKHRELFDLLGVATYLRAQMNDPMFLVEEDYLLSVESLEEEARRREEEGMNSRRQRMRAKLMAEQAKQKEEEQNDDEFTVDRTTQTDEMYDVRAASYLPKEEDQN